MLPILKLIFHPFIICKNRLYTTLENPGMYVLKAKVRFLVDGEEGELKLQVCIKLTAIASIVNSA